MKTRFVQGDLRNLIGQLVAIVAGLRRHFEISIFFGIGK